MKKNLLFFLGFAAVFFFVFKSLILNLNSNLIDWRDYSYIAWVINQNIYHLKALDFAHLFNLNAFYPNSNTLFLSDTLITQAFIGIPFSFFTDNPVLIINLIFIVTFLLNYFSAYLLFDNVLKNKLIAFIGGVALVFSPFFYTQLGHFQMQNYWPFIFILFILLKDQNKKSFRNEVLIGILLAIQFLASVYLAFFAVFAIATNYAIRVLKGYRLRKILAKFGVVIIVFLLLGGIFIKGYLDARKDFSISRPPTEYLTYSAKITDYIFPRQNGIFYQNPVINKWKTFNKHQYGETASFPGFILGGLAILGLVRFKKGKNSLSLSFSTDTRELLFLVLIIIGFLFSLGYPYLPFVKYLPLFDTIRGTSRWSFLFYIGIVYFAALSISKIKAEWLIAAASLLLLTDVLPGQISTFRENYIGKNDEILRSVCTGGNQVVLEIPVTHFDAGNNIAEGLSYITKRLLATLYNRCTLVNGYGGYDLPRIQKIKDDLLSSTQAGNADLFVAVLRNSGANYVVINRESIQGGLYPKLSGVLAELTKMGKIKYISESVYQIY